MPKAEESERVEETKAFTRYGCRPPGCGKFGLYTGVMRDGPKPAVCDLCGEPLTEIKDTGESWQVTFEAIVPPSNAWCPVTAPHPDEYGAREQEKGLLELIACGEKIRNVKVKCAAPTVEPESERVREIRVGDDGLQWLDETIESLKEYPNSELDSMAAGPPYDYQRLVGIRSHITSLEGRVENVVPQEMHDSLIEQLDTLKAKCASMERVVTAAYELEIAIRFGSYVKELEALNEALADHDSAIAGTEEVDDGT